MNGVWVDIHNPSKQTCADQDCHGIVTWGDGTEYDPGNIQRISFQHWSPQYESTKYVQDRKNMELFEIGQLIFQKKQMVLE